MAFLGLNIFRMKMQGIEKSFRNLNIRKSTVFNGNKDSDEKSENLEV